ncbi:hypothetical protein [Paenibacillus sp.]|jgi:hypothetical protein|uniref:hypothetical protein n=1 Tax=Paenibacillus sp. TaxID=58172 RepID=UPI00282187D1|nr:hypothetical protein [Paenibacillus sp.]MDR0268333.1 hypothetical protein [Paenibacillus sp.]
MSDEKDFGTEARSNNELQTKTQLDILKVMEQCGIHPDRWYNYIRQGDRLLETEQT